LKLRILIVEMGGRLDPQLRTRLEDVADTVSVNTADRAVQGLGEGHCDLTVISCSADRQPVCELCPRLTELTYVALPIVVSMQTNDIRVR